MPSAFRGSCGGMLLLVVAMVAMLAHEPLSAQSNGYRDGSRDFDFEFGEWTAHIARLENPLTGSTTWAEYTGTSVVRQVWNGRANLGELDVAGPAGRIEGLSLRLYNPETRQWRISWASSRNGVIDPAMIGGFRDGIGEFYNQEMFNGRSIFVRFIFSDITPTSFRLEQAFSEDGGKSWEANWIAKFERSGETDESAQAGIRSLWSRLDALWNERDAQRFSELFTVDGNFVFVDTGVSLDGRAAIQESFAERFPDFAPNVRHRTTVAEIRDIAPDVHTVDGKVEILRMEPDAGADPTVVRRFAIFAVLVRGDDGWGIRELRAFQVR